MRLSEKRERTMLKKIPEILLGVGIALLSVLLSLAIRRIDLKAPEITFPDTELVYTPGDGLNVLLAGVTAEDNEDGDVTASLTVESVLVLSDSELLVTYTAEDAAKNVTRLNRRVRYTGGGE